MCKVYNENTRMTSIYVDGVLVYLLLTLNRFHILFWYFYIFFLILVLTLTFVLRFLGKLNEILFFMTTMLQCCGLLQKTFTCSKLTI